MHFSSAIAGMAVVAGLVAAHPGHDHDKEQFVRRSFLQYSKRDLSHCADKIKARGLEARNVQRRQELARHTVEKRGLPSRSINARMATALGKSHHSTAAFDLTTPESVLFATNASCILAPDVIEGPYWVNGQYVRRDITDGEPGIPLTLDLQVLDINTCDPVVGAYTELWHANSTGVYSGVSAAGNGNSLTDLSNLKATFLRGIQPTDRDGVVQFDTTVTGWYTGRTPHMHLLVHYSDNATAPLVRANGTIADTTASHVGQIYFDQALIDAVNATALYAANTQVLTRNDEDTLLPLSAAGGADPIIDTVLLSDTVDDGVLGWIAFGVDRSEEARIIVDASVTLYENGGVINPNSTWHNLPAARH